jgi:hypothetical protein
VSLNIYPNPARTGENLQIQTTDEIISIQLYTIDTDKKYGYKKHNNKGIATGNLYNNNTNRGRNNL